MNGLGILAEGLLRIEHKLDAILRFLAIKTVPMHFIGQMCPACSQQIDYQIDVQHQLVKRRCACKTGKVPSTIPLTPVGDSNAKAETGSSESSVGSGNADSESDRANSKNGASGKTRGVGSGNLHR